MANRHWRTWVIVLLALLFAAAGIWFAQSRGWWSPASRGRVAKETGDGAMSGMDMSGMDMKGGANQGRSEPTVPSGHAEITIAPEVQQGIGVTIGSVEMGPLRMSVRTVGIVQPDETRIARLHLRTEGWIQKLFVNFTGQLVQKGDPLLALYSPDFVSAQQEYLIARRAERNQGGGDAARSLAGSAVRRLQLLDVPDEALKELEDRGEPQEYVTLRSPIDGTVLKKNVHERDYVGAEKELYVIADLSTVWVQAKVYEYELPHVELGQPVVVTISALPERELTGKIVFIEPTVEERARTIQVRIELANEDGRLKPGMFAHVTIDHHMGEGLLVPTSAIIRTGERDLAYRVKPPGKFVPVDVKIDNVKFGDWFHVLQGLQAGDEIVTSANFLIDSESRLRAGAGGMPEMEGMEKGSMKDVDHSPMK